MIPWRTLLRSRAFPAAVALLGLLCLDGIFVPRFLDLDLHEGRVHGALVDVLLRGAPLLLLALGMTPVIGTGGVDLSVGSIMSVPATGNETVGAWNP